MLVFLPLQQLLLSSLVPFSLLFRRFTVSRAYAGIQDPIIHHSPVNITNFLSDSSYDRATAVRPADSQRSPFSPFDGGHARIRLYLVYPTSCVGYK